MLKAGNERKPPSRIQKALYDGWMNQKSNPGWVITFPDLVSSVKTTKFFFLPYLYTIYTFMNNIFIGYLCFYIL